MGSVQDWYGPYLVKQLLACGALLDGKLQLSVHGGDANIDLWGKMRKPELKDWPEPTKMFSCIGAKT